MKMATLKLIDFNLDPKLRCGDRLYYDVYQYCLSFRLENLSALRGPYGPVAEFQEEIRWRFENRRNNMLRYGQRNLGGSWRTVQNPNFMDESALQNLLDFAELLVPNLDLCKLVVSGTHGYVYSNDITLLKHIAQAGCIEPLKITEMAVTHPRDRVLLRRSQHSHRSYFRDRNLSDNEYETLRNFLTLRCNQMRLSPALNNWLNETQINHGLLIGQRFARRYTMRHWFIDHDAGIPLLLELVVPRLIRETKPIQVNN